MVRNRGKKCFVGPNLRRILNPRWRLDHPKIQGGDFRLQREPLYFAIRPIIFPADDQVTAILRMFMSGKIARAKLEFDPHELALCAPVDLPSLTIGKLHPNLVDEEAPL